MRNADERFGPRQLCGARGGFAAQLHERSAAAHVRSGERKRVEPAALAHFDVDDRVEGTQTASARPALPGFLSIT